MKPKILLLGAGYGGLTTAIHLQRELSYNEANITLVNKHHYHYIATHLHQSAAGTTNAKRLKIEISELIDPDMIHFVKDEVVDIDIENRSIKLKHQKPLEYDILVIALGSEVETFGIKGLNDYAFSIRSINSVQLIREHIDYMFAKYKAEAVKDSKYLTFIVGGAGFTGIEFVGELGDNIPRFSEKFSVDRDKVRIINVEAKASPLPGFDPKLVEYAVDVLKKKGVEFKLNTPIKECKEDGIILENGEEIKSSTIVWTGGVRGNKLIEQIGLDTIKGRVKVDEYLRPVGYEYVFIIGDNSLIYDEDGKPYPPTAQIATQQGVHVAKQLLSYIRNGAFTLNKFDYENKGTLASIGKGLAVGKIGKWKLSGYTAFFMKQMVDNKYLYSIGGIPLLIKKGKLLAR